jgi:hypothetical protein
MIYLLRIVEYVIIAHFSEKNNPSYEKGLILQGKTPSAPLRRTGFLALFVGMNKKGRQNEKNSPIYCEKTLAIQGKVCYTIIVQE